MSRGEVTACTTKAKARAKATDFVGITNGVPAATVRIAVFYTADSLGRLGWDGKPLWAEFLQTINHPFPFPSQIIGGLFDITHYP